MCWFPRKPWRLRIEREGFEHVIRCSECPGCLEFERRRLADRFAARYGAKGGELFTVRVSAPLELHRELSDKLHRRRHLELEPGFARLGVGSFAILSRECVEVRRVLGELDLKHRVERVRLKRGRRAWRSLTAGIAVSRDSYGEHVKRFYFRGLPAAEREKWEIVKVGKYRTYDRLRSARAWKDGNLVLVPPEIWAMRRVDRVALRKSMSMAGSPELAVAIAQVLARVSITKPQTTTQLLRSPAKPVPSVSSKTPTSEVGGYVSSPHLQDELWPKPASDEELLRPGPSGDLLWMERERAKLARTEERKATQRTRMVDDSLAIIERMRQLAEKRGRNA